MDYQTLRNELLTSPRAATYAPYVVLNTDPKQDASGKDKTLADMLNAPAGTRVISRFVNSLQLLGEFPPSSQTNAAAILDKLEAAKLISSDVKWAFNYITTDTGVDLGGANTRYVLDALATAGTANFTQADADALKNLAVVPSSAAYDAVGEPVTAADVSIALRGNALFTPV